MTELGDNLPRLAAELDKPTPHFLLDKTLTALKMQATHRQRLADAMTHILRNSMDHGIESAAARQTAGKSANGRTSIESIVDTNEVVLWVADDGQGLPLHRLRDKALAAGLRSADELTEDEQLAELIFHSGLSTAEQLSMVSGRGVGMDAVRASLAEIGAQLQSNGRLAASQAV